MAILVKDSNGQLIPLSSNGRLATYNTDEAAEEALHNGELQEGNIVGILNTSLIIGVAGMVVPFAGATAPAGWLLCDGSAVSRETYTALFSVIGTAYGAGDGSTTFNVPDLRESVPVGVGQSSNDYNASTNPTGIVAHDVYDLGQFKDDQMQTHNHQLEAALSTGSNTGFVRLVFCNKTDYLDRKNTWGMSSDARAGAVTRGKRVGMNYIIKY